VWQPAPATASPHASTPGLYLNAQRLITHSDHPNAAAPPKRRQHHRHTSCIQGGPTAGAARCELRRRIVEPTWNSAIRMPTTLIRRSASRNRTLRPTAPIASNSITTGSRRVVLRSLHYHAQPVAFLANSAAERCSAFTD